MDLEEKTVRENRIFDGQILHVRKDDILLPNGQPATREYITHVGAVGVIALTARGNVILEKQYRYPFHRVMTEIPAGKLNFHGEDPLEAAKRELAEETGITAEKWTYLGEFAGSVAILDERLHLYLAEGLTRGDCSPDEDEFLEIFEKPLREIYADVMRGAVADGKTQVAVLRVAAMRGLS